MTFSICFIIILQQRIYMVVEKYSNKTICKTLNEETTISVPSSSIRPTQIVNGTSKCQPWWASGLQAVSFCTSRYRWAGVNFSLIKWKYMYMSIFNMNVLNYISKPVSVWAVMLIGLHLNRILGRRTVVYLAVWANCLYNSITYFLRWC